MLEKIVTLENISLVDFLGIENQNIKTIASVFPDSRIISRGNEIRIKGSQAQIIKINEILRDLLNHYHEFGKITTENVTDYVANERNLLEISRDSETLVHGIHGRRIVPKTMNQKKLISAVEKNDVVFAIGPAGTGKTYISVALAVRALKNNEVKRIIITRPTVEAGEHLGFLPGDLKEKIDPYIRPIYDSLRDMISSEKLKYYKENGMVEIAPLAYMRGRTLHDAYVLLDEAQNTTPNQIKMLLTRIGPRSKVIITGDTSQIDLPKKQLSGLIETMKVLKNVKGIKFVTLDNQDVMRHKLVKSIIKAYNTYDIQNDKSDKQ